MASNYQCFLYRETKYLFVVLNGEYVTFVVTEEKYKFVKETRHKGEFLGVVEISKTVGSRQINTFKGLIIFYNVIL